MKEYLINPLSPEEQQRIMGQMYLLLGNQAKNYHKHRRMGESSSVTVELAQELMESLDYTLGLTGGAFPGMDLAEALKTGQGILEGRLQKAKSMLDLVVATAPEWQTECRWEALQYLRRYLRQYDHLHLAHHGPDGLFYPILIAQPEGIRGIDCCLFYLNILWIENQIMAGVTEDALDALWRQLPAYTLNQCEQLLLNGIGKAVLGTGIDSLVFSPEEHMRITLALTDIREDGLKAAARRLCQWLDLRGEDTVAYASAILPRLLPRIGKGATTDGVVNLFL